MSADRTAALSMVVAALAATITDEELRRTAKRWRTSFGNDLGDAMAVEIEAVIDRREALARQRAS